jgi:hypothetical protein
VKVIHSHSCGLVVPDDAIKCPHCLAAFQPAHLRALSNGAVVGLIVGIALIALCLLTCTVARVILFVFQAPARPRR